VLVWGKQAAKSGSLPSRQQVAAVTGAVPPQRLVAEIDWP